MAAGNSTAAEALFGLTTDKIRYAKYLVVFGAISVYLVVWVKTMFDLSWLSLKGLTVSVPPTREELVKFSAAKGGGAVGKDKKGRKRSSDSAPKLKDKGGRTVGSGRKGSKGSAVATDDGGRFTVPNDAPIELKSAPLTKEDIVSWLKYPEWMFIVHLFFGTLGTTVVVELVSYFIVPTLEGLTLCFMWAGTASFMSWVQMMMTVLDYVTNSVTYEIIITLSVLIVSLLTSLGVLLATDTCFDFNLDGGYASFVEGMTDVCKATGLGTCETLLPSLKVAKLMLAVVSALISVALLFPTMRFARCQTSAARHFKEHTLTSLVLNLNAVLPVLVLLSFIPSLARVPYTGVESIFAPCKSASGSCLVVVVNQEFEFLRLALLGIALWVRFTSVRIHLQSFFYMPIDQLSALAKGKKQRLNPIAIQNTVVRVSQFGLSTALQLLCPVVFIGSCLIILIVRGYQIEQVQAEEVSKMNPEFYRALFSYLCWWSMLVHSVISTLGWVYFAIAKGD